MEEQFSRTEKLIGTQAMEKLHQAKIAIFGIGGVGSYTAEALARVGIGEFVLVDKDTIDITNLNRQIHATHQTIGKAKVEVMKQRILDINPEAKITIYQELYLPQNNDKIIDGTFSYIVDAVDMVTAKLEIIQNAKKAGVPIISCMGTGNKINPTMLRVADIQETTVCPLAKVIRKELKKRKIEQVKVVYSTEEPIVLLKQEELRTPASISFVPSTAGLIIASEVVKDMIA